MSDEVVYEYHEWSINKESQVYRYAMCLLEDAVP